MPVSGFSPPLSTLSASVPVCVPFERGFSPFVPLLPRGVLISLEDGLNDPVKGPQLRCRRILGSPVGRRLWLERFSLWFLSPSLTSKST